MLATLAYIATAAQVSSPLMPVAPPHDRIADTRIQTLVYDGSQVFDLRIGAGYAAMIELATEERVETIVVGNDAGWHVTPSRSGNRVIVKPMDGAMMTNMVIVTDQRRYVFVINSQAGEGSGTFVLRFSYPDSPTNEVQHQRRNADYRLKGARELFPLLMSDDGKRTTITWDLNTALPAIFAVDERGQEALVNGRMVDGDYRIEGVAQRYVFRLGKARALATRTLLKSQQ
ncbi:TrbG/VirB9 family P-type conjugative transfer protein [Sphingomonas sp. 3-13AW]|uniref:TrbG/VirB9 family P-type conjugative transfer protein n=1 Tax=Sphingomonas sp. 3-13AW TaxID=3050450 RepID=UPI003BB7F5DD